MSTEAIDSGFKSILSTLYEVLFRGPWNISEDNDTVKDKEEPPRIVPTSYGI